MPKLSKEEFYKKYYPSVVEATKGTGLHPEAVIAQMAIESGWGGSGLTEKYNNFFGIKSHGKKGGTTMQTDEERGGVRAKESASFRTYEDPVDSIKDYVSFLQENPRYKDVFKSKSPDEQADALQKAGYATSSRYANDIKRTIKANSGILDTIPEHKEYLKTSSVEQPGDTTVIKQGNKEFIYNPEDGNVYPSPSGSDEFTDEEWKSITDFMDSQSKETDPDTKGKIVPDFLKENNFTPLSTKEIDAIKTHLDKGNFSTVDNNRVAKKAKNTPLGNKIVDYFKGVYERSLEEKKEIPPTEVGKATSTQAKGKFVPNIHDINDPVDPASIDPNNIGEVDDIDAIRKRLATNENLLSDIERKKPFDESYAPDDVSDRSVAENLMDAGRGIMGIFGADKEIPKYTQSKIFKDYAEESAQRRNLGLSEDEIGLRKQLSERGFGYDVKNIKRLSGGSSGVALGNLGRATGQLQDRYSQIAAEDEGVRRQNRREFGMAARAWEPTNRQIFEDDLNQAMMTKQAASGLVSDAMSNIKDRGQYNKTYGKGSQIYEYEKELTLSQRQNREMLQEANDQRTLDYFNEIRSDIDADKLLLEKRTGNYSSLTGDEPPAKGYKTKEEALDAEYDKFDVNDPANADKIKEIERVKRMLKSEGK